MKVRRSAGKHGIDRSDSISAATWPVWTAPLDDDHPQRFLHLGFDTKGRLLELVTLVWDDGTVELIHAMKARPQYRDLLD